MPVTALVINLVLAVQVRRAAANAAANLGVQPHHQSTSSSSAVPAVMLIATSLIYVLLHAMPGILVLVSSAGRLVTGDDDVFIRGPMVVLNKCLITSFALSPLIYAYNFYVYLITGKLFRSDLRQLVCRCPSFSCSCSSPAVAVVVAAVGDDNDDDAAGVARRVRTDTAV